MSGEYSRIATPPRMCASLDEPEVPKDKGQYSKIKVIPLPPHKCDATLCARVIVSSADKKDKLFQARVLNTLRQQVELEFNMRILETKQDAVMKATIRLNEGQMETDTEPWVSDLAK